VTFNLFLIYTSLRYLSLSEFWMVNSCTPFPTAILCWYFLSEKFTRMQGICCGKSNHHQFNSPLETDKLVLSIVGVLLITNPLGPSNSISGPGNLEDHIPTEPIYKVLGLAAAIPSTLLIGTEGMSVSIYEYNPRSLIISVVIMRVMGDQVGHVQVLTTLAVAPAVITAWYAPILHNRRRLKS
jgi:drug/metabolite transporter (DMT)-like permease